MIVELQQEAEIHYLRSRIQFDEECFDPGMYRRNQAAKFQFASSYIEEKGFCPASLGFLMYAPLMLQVHRSVLYSLLYQVTVLVLSGVETFNQSASLPELSMCSAAGPLYFPLNALLSVIVVCWLFHSDISLTTTFFVLQVLHFLQPSYVDNSWATHFRGSHSTY